MDNLKDGIFSPGSEIERQKDESWLIRYVVWEENDPDSQDKKGNSKKLL